VLCGACGEAFARDKWEHFVIGFKPPPQEEVQSWSCQPQLLPHKRRAPVQVKSGDILGCLYGKDGRIRLWHNGALVLNFDVGRPAEEDVDYYAVVDVCLSAYCLTVLPFTSPAEVSAPGLINPPRLQRLAQPLQGGSSGSGGAVVGRGTEAWAEAIAEEAAFPAQPIDDLVSTVVHHALVKTAIRRVVGECQFCVTVADPRGNDIPLIAVSEAFEAMTGYTRSEVLGVNCRFLNHGCPVSRQDLIGLQIASASGSAFTALLPNRKKSGEQFINLLDLRGLTIARHCETNEEMWYLIGIQADVTGLAENNVPEGHIKELQQVAALIRTKLRRELSRLAAKGAEQLDRQHTSSSGSSHKSAGESPKPKWRLLEDPVWTATTLCAEEVREHLPAAPARSRGDQPQGAEQAPPEEVPPATLADARQGQVSLPIGRRLTGMILVSFVAFVAGLLLGRTSRRR